MYKIIAYPLTLVAAVLALSACGNDEQYVVNDKNCQPDHIRSLPSNDKREKLMEGCMTR
ncbi:entry exclusion lipoprotein TrbK [Pseudomonas sp. NBRC 111119]|uniref:entry exclusion lipoprotein TrbK n=1 Tax=Pseudomonas sp. NBRC 111119 TaxID=1661034 RepID=UPI0009E7ACB7|nr:entry exclusion lipoprotein TrbK [Pseudomonas sp. NBRC 111119]